MTEEEYQTALERCGGSQEILDRKKRWHWMQRWREVYASALHAATGSWKLGKFDWHVFSHPYARALNGQKAMLAYEEERPKVLLICPEYEVLPAVRLLVAKRKPSFRQESGDVYVFPEDLSWTVAFTHEESLELGPYFSRREWIADGPPERPRRMP
jgi:hypothetical protein